jgi:hypothetical protein
MGLKDVELKSYKFLKSKLSKYGLGRFPPIKALANFAHKKLKQDFITLQWGLQQLHKS